METKIEWFKEFLEIEPNSKIFFPLARLLCEDGRSEEAIETLRKGVERHPDHLEARFLLVELMRERGEDDGAAREADGLATTLSQYPAFWQVWAERSAPKSRDSALALSFLASTFRGRSITWSQVIEEGLRAIFASDGGRRPAAAAPAEEVEEIHFEALPDIEFMEEETPVAAPLDLEVAAEAAKAYSAESAEQAIAQVLAEEAGGDAEDFTLEPEPGEGGEEPGADGGANIRTRTMADLLAEQGDCKGALAIYQELAASSQGAEAAELSALIAKMQARMRRGAPAAAPEARPTPGPLPGKERMLSTLEALAERLEARARV